ncbi:unnamed protein product [marine sediment metagenome]|uniref:Uncharacterized protein n=1 Tax=marine sediment metagenome TaxID=412755 RepID=X0UDT7_9ZZZZ
MAERYGLDSYLVGEYEMSGIRKTIIFREKEYDELEIEIYDDNIAFRQFIDYDNNSFITFDWIDVKKLIKTLEEILKEKQAIKNGRH